MKYPNFLSKNNTIGICAPSEGLGGKLEDFKVALKVLKSEGYKIKETKSVRVNASRSTTAKNRARELDELVTDKNVDMIIMAAGGDYMYEILPHVNFKSIKDNPKWMMGYSDPTNLLFTTTTILDIATIYGYNAISYNDSNNKAQKDNLNIIGGNLIKQNSHPKYNSFLDKINGKYDLDREVKWISKDNNINITGRCIGGCLDVIDKIIGTQYDYVDYFIERYKDDGIVWYFDLFNMSSLNFYLTLLQLKNAGWFKYTKAVLVGRVAFETIEDKKFDYIKAADKALKGIPHIMNMDIGHTNPHMTLINGALINVKYKDNKGSISFKLK